MASRENDRALVGWRELVALPDLTSARIPAKIDTGARTSSLHASEVERFERDGQRWLRFLLDVGHGSSEPVTVEVPRVDRRTITSSNGETESRPIIKTQLRIGSLLFPAEFSLSDRSDMKFPILIGRTALRGRFLVDSGRSYLQSDAAERRTLLK
ncbi:ATP-dependent zinc protease [Tsuneonella mangrovi]|uniref:ATP-dependent zinc protease family protein n=1 Tax=Tsuneonella mangrovi TaxID=1982042 RepID=UPI000BA26403|nr:RimK/LysX family protein [Tsuneonella mangrovi]